ncbi:MAG: hypothetical protein ACLF0P_04290 [Thermoanaerobaculia bacterium]
MDSLLTTSLLALRGGGFSREEIELAEKLGRLFNQVLERLLEPSSDEEPADTALRVLATAASELRSLGRFLADAFDQPLSELLEAEEKPILLHAYRADLGSRFGRELLVLAVRFEATFNPTERELLDWRRGLPEAIPHWEPPRILEPPARPWPEAGEEANFLASRIAPEIRGLRVFLERAQNHVHHLWLTLPEEARRGQKGALAEGGPKRLAHDLRDLELEIESAAGCAHSLVEDLARSSSADDQPRKEG